MPPGKQESRSDAVGLEECALQDLPWTGSDFPKLVYGQTRPGLARACVPQSLLLCLRARSVESCPVFSISRCHFYIFVRVQSVGVALRRTHKKEKRKPWATLRREW